MIGRTTVARSTRSGVIVSNPELRSRQAHSCQRSPRRRLLLVPYRGLLAPGRGPRLRSVELPGDEAEDREGCTGWPRARSIACWTSCHLPLRQPRRAAPLRPGRADGRGGHDQVAHPLSPVARPGWCEARARPIAALPAIILPTRQPVGPSPWSRCGPRLVSGRL